MSDIRIEVIKELNNNFVGKWHEVWENQQNIHFFNSPEWFISCLKTFNIKNYSIFVGYRNEQIKIIWPVVKMRKFGINVLGSPGGKYLDKSSLLFVDNDLEIIEALVEKILKNANIYLVEINKEIKNNIVDLGITRLIWQASINPYISLDLEPFRFIKNKQRNEIRNKIKKHQNSFSFKLYVDNLDRYLETIFEIEKKSFKRKKGKHIFNKKIAKNLFSNIISKQGNVSISLLYFNNKPIAHMFGLICKKRFLGYHMAYLEGYRKLIPGKVLLYFLLLELVKRRFTLFDFSRGDSILKKQFTQQKKIQYDIFISKKVIVNFYISCIFFVNGIWLFAKKYIKILLNKE